MIRRLMAGRGLDLDMFVSCIYPGSDMLCNIAMRLVASAAGGGPTFPWFRDV